MATKIRLAAVTEALELATDELSSYVSNRTGEVVTLSHETMRLAERGSREDLPEWQLEELRLTKDVLESTDWLELPNKFAVHEWEIMNRFGQSISVLAQREEVLDAIHRSGAFRQFKNTIRRLLLEDAWYAFKSSALDELARAWLGEHGFEIDEGDDRIARGDQR